MSLEVEIYDEHIELFPQKAMFWKKYGTLFLADVHLGKINHFRRSGIAVPVQANERNLEQLVELIQATHPKRVVFLGDLFHSHYNPEWEVFGELVKHFENVSFELVVGNHDIMSDQQYIRKGIVCHDKLMIGPFLFTHHPVEEIPDSLYNFSGHLHPGVVLRGRGRQAVTLPCFCFGSRQALLPAFGEFTGLAKIRPKKDDRIFVVADNRVLLVS